MVLAAAVLAAGLLPGPGFGQGPRAGDTPALTPDGLVQDAAGALLKVVEERWTVLVATSVYSWTKEKGWAPSWSLGDSERAAIRHAVEEFNNIPGLALKLEYKETNDPAVTLENPWSNRDKLVVYWAEDAEKGGLGPPFQWRGKSYITGCSTVLRDPKGRFTYQANEENPAGAVIGGGMIFMVEFTQRLRGLFKCKEDGPFYVALHEIGHCLGLGHRTPAPSIMFGTCGTAYLPNDIQNFRRLYGN